MVKIGLKSRSRRVVQDSSVAVAKNKEIDADENCGRCCWENLPGELLREVLSKLERSESNWPERKHVVACAGVCKIWRETMKDLVQTPELSGKITFPISVKQPGPRGSFLRCFVKRNRACQSYHLFVSLSQALATDGKCILIATKRRRATCTDYLISLHVDGMSKGNNTYIGKLRSNFLATKFVVYDALPPIPESKFTKSRSTHSVDSKQPRAGNYPVAHISYELNMLGARGPRRMNCVMDSISTSTMKPGGVAPIQTYLPISRVKSFQFFRAKSTHLSGALSDQGEIDRPLVLRNKAPHWHEQLQCWCLNFHGRVTVASVKNFQLVASPENGPEQGDVILQFGKVGKDVFTMDYQYPISAFQAFAICLSSFDTKIACE